MMPMPLETVMRLIKERWSLSTAGPMSGPAMIRIAPEAVHAEIWPMAADKALLFVTADISYHERQDALNCGQGLSKSTTVDGGQPAKAPVDH